MKNVIRLDNYYSPEDLTRSVNEFVEHYNYKRYHESLGNITPADVNFGKDLEIIQQRSKIKEKTLYERRQNYIKEKLKLTYEIL
jgi:putative transposase